MGDIGGPLTKILRGRGPTEYQKQWEITLSFSTIDEMVEALVLLKGME